MKEQKKLVVGGQALIEGVMMVGGGKTFAAFRRQDGRISVEQLASLKKDFWSKIPFIRGVISLVRQLVVGTSAMLLGARFASEDENEVKNKVVETHTSENLHNESIKDEKTSREAEILNKNATKEDLKKENSNQEAETSKKTSILLYLATFLGLASGILLFIILPHLLTHFIFRLLATINFLTLEGRVQSIFYALIEGFFRIAILLIYLYLLRFQKDTYRMWQYHGAEHKCIACFEQSLPLTVNNVSLQTRFHKRCGTSFIFQVLFLSIFFFTLIGKQSLLVGVLLRLVCMPLIAATSFELLQWSSRSEKTFLGRLIIAPGLWVQRLTTAEPDAEHIEVAIEALRPIIEKCDEELV